MKLIKFFNDGALDTVVSQFATEFNIDKKVMEIIYSKGYRTKEEITNFLSPETQSFVNPFKLKGMKELCDKIHDAVKTKKDVLIFGDYDVDGISATAIMIILFKKLGLDARYYLPNRFVDGYGLTVDVIDKICKTKKPDLIITVDCGITCYQEVEHCKELGIDIVITDHHELVEKLPETIIINPKYENQEYNFKGLCGTGVAFKIAQALLGENECEDILPIATIATIADIVPLKFENRTIVAKGLKLLNKLPYGLKCLFKQNKLNLDKIEANDIAFKIAPKLNASGRMGDANDSLMLILENNPAKVKQLLEKINAHNTRRQELCNNVFEDCMEQLKNENISNLPAIILKSNNWDSGILGIVCSRILEIYNRPVILFSENNGELKGSARSIEDVNIHQVLNSVKDILEVFGGHKVAAGLTLKSVHYQEFKNRVCSFMIQNINNTAFIPIDYYDVELNLNDINEKFYNDLKLLEPCGCENSKPRFMIKSSKIKITPLKINSPHAYVGIDKKLNLIYFNYLKEYAKLNFGKEYKFVFEFQSLNKNVFKGIIKTIDISENIKDSASKYFNAFKFLQLKYFNYANSNIEIKNCMTYESTDLINFLVDCSSNAFGTCFVSYNVQVYNDFIRTYDLKNIYEINFLKTNVTGFNSIFLCPQDISFVKSFKNIIFLDSVLDKTFIYAINQISNANVYIPKTNYKNDEIFSNLNLTRIAIKNFYINLTKLENNLFLNVISVYSKMVKELKYKINFNNFLIYYYILTELKIVIPYENNGLYCFKINKNIKTELNKSKIYNVTNLIRRIYGRN